MPYLEKIVSEAPQDPQRPFFLHNLGMCRLLVGDVDAAMERLHQSVIGNPHYFGAPLLLAAALGLKSAHAEAKLNLQLATRLSPQFRTVSRLGDWIRQQAASDLVPLYEHTVERGLQWAGMPVE